MAQVNGYEYDIFISYAHADNVPIGKSAGWVTRFHSELEPRLQRLRDLRDIKIWRDQALNGNTLFDDSIQQRIQNSALFIALYSHNYQASDYCQQEINCFIQHNKNNLAVDQESRILHLLLNDIPHPEWPSYLPKTSGFIFHGSNGNNFSEPLEIYEQRYQAMGDLIEAIFKTIKAFPNTPKPKLTDPSTRPTIAPNPQTYLIETHACDQKYAFELSAQLESHHQQVIFNREYSEQEQAARLTDLEQKIGQAKQLILMFGQAPYDWLHARIAVYSQIMSARYANNTNFTHDIWICQLPGSQGLATLAEQVPLKLKLIHWHDAITIDLLLGKHQTLLSGNTPANKPLAQIATINPYRTNPYVGLRAYEPEDASYYFGRHQQTDELQARLHQHRFVAIVGNSGSGKSSLIKAGLIPRLHAGFLVDGIYHWQVLKIKPGDDPIGNLLSQFVTSNKLPTLTTQIKQQGTEALLATIRQRMAQQTVNLFLLVDQFEEIFLFNDPQQANKAELKQNANLFIDLLLQLAAQRELAIFVCLTMRSDYLGDCDAFHGLPEAINRSQFLVPRLNREQRREVIISPAKSAGGQLAPELVEALLDEDIDTHDDLPMLQHVLMRTWDEWQKDTQNPEHIGLSHYQQAKTIQHALDDHAEQAYASLQPEQQIIAQRLFQAITKLDDGNRGIRRPQHLNELAAVAEASPNQVMQVVQSFREQNRSFLIVSNENADSDPLIDISHESLIRKWQRLQTWVKQERQSAEEYSHLEKTAVKWQGRPSNLWRDEQLKEANTWWDEQKPTSAWAARYGDNFTLVEKFLDASNTEQNQAEKAKVKRAKQRFALISTIAIITISLSLLATQQWYVAEQALADAQHNIGLVLNEKSKQSANNNQYNQANLYDTHALAKLDPARNPELIHAIQNRILASPYIKPVFTSQYVDRHDSPVNAVAFAPDGKTLASGSWDGTIRLWNVQSGKQLAVLNGHQSGVTSVAFAPDGKTLASGSDDKTIRLWDVQSGKQLAVLNGHQDDINSVAFAPHGKTLASGSDDGTIRLWDVQSGRQLTVLNGHQSGVTSIAFAPDGKTLASGSRDRTIRLWDTQSGKQLAVLSGHQSDVTSVAFAPDGKTLASGSWDGAIRLWDTQFGKQLAMLSGHQRPVTSVAFAPDGKTLASGSWNGTIRLWDAQFGKQLAMLSGHQSGVTSIAFAPDGKTLASGSWDKIIRLWDVQSGKQLTVLSGHQSYVNSVAFAPDGKMLASGSDDNTIRLWDAQSGKQLAMLSGHQSDVTSVAFAPNGKTLASGSWDKTIRLWDAQSGKQLAVLKGHQYNVTSIAFAPDGKTLASGSWDKIIRLWDVQSDKQLAVLKGHQYNVTSIAFAPDGKTLASGSGAILGGIGTTRLWDVQSGKQLTVLSGHQSYVNSVAFAPDGKMLASGSGAILGGIGTTRLWDVQSGKQLTVLNGHQSYVTSVAFAPDGKTLASASNDRTIRLWKVETKNTELLRITESFDEYFQQQVEESSFVLDGIELKPKPHNLNSPPYKAPQWRSTHPFYWMPKADAGDANAMREIGLIYDRGNDNERALQWYRKAVKAGDAQAKERLSFLLTWLGDKATCGKATKDAEDYYTQAQEIDANSVVDIVKRREFALSRCIN